MTARSAFGGGDQSDLRDVQCRDGRELDVRARLHRGSATAPVACARFEAELIAWMPESRRSVSRVARANVT